MSNNASAPQEVRPGVSTNRKIFSAIALTALLVVLGIEVRAGLGQSQTAKAFAAVTSDGRFNDVLLDDAKRMVAMSPSETVIRDNENETVHHYQWYSLLRPLIGQQQPELYLVSRPGDPVYAVAFYTDSEDAQSGFYGDGVVVEDDGMGGYVDPANDNPLGLPDAPEKPAEEKPAADGDQTSSSDDASK